MTDAATESLKPMERRIIPIPIERRRNTAKAWRVMLVNDYAQDPPARVVMARDTWHELADDFIDPGLGRLTICDIPFIIGDAPVGVARFEWDAA